MDAVIVTHNSGEHLEQLLTCDPLRTAFDRLIVVDNCSSDGSAEMAHQAGALVLACTERQGYGTCVNLGALETSGESFAVLNPDILFASDDVVDHLERHLLDPGVGLVAPALVLPAGRVQDSARRIPTPIDLILRRCGQRERGAVRDTGDVPWVVGACFVVSRAAWDEVGGFNERYFLYFEDVDLCWRLWRAGFRVRFDAGVRVRHQHNADSRKSLLGWAARRHLASAARFYANHPRFVLSDWLPQPAHPPVLAPAPAPMLEPAPRMASLAALSVVGEEA
jgi:GT2 family glycosyltransferase